MSQEETLSAAWIAIDLQPGLARGWTLRGGDMQGQAQVPAAETLSDSAGLVDVVDQLRTELGTGPQVPALISGAPPGVLPCVATPAKPADLPLHPLPDLNALALPPLAQARPAGVMAGAAARIAGFFALNPNWDGVLCLPGPITHWVQVSAEEIVSFQGFATGAMARALMQAPLFRAAITGPDWDAAAFDQALDDGLSRPERLAAIVAAVQADHTLGQISPGAAPARLLGGLIGAELAAARPYWLGQQIAVLGDGAEAQAYVTALQRQGAPCLQADPARMALAGLTGLWRRLAGDSNSNGIA